MTASSMIQPLFSDDTFLESVAASRADPSALHLWWLGQSGFLVSWEGRFLLFDPYLSDSLTVKYAPTDKPHVRMTERVIAPERLNFIDVVTSSHNHTDHLDRETLEPLKQANPDLALVIPEANRSFVTERLGWNAGIPIGLTAGQTIRVKGFSIHGVPAAHNELETDAGGRHKFMGYVVQAGPWTLYHSGDTLHYQGMEDLLRPWHVDVAMLPINGNLPERRVAGNLDGREAAQLAKTIGAKLVIPCHFEMFEFNTASPDLFTRTCAELDQPSYVMKAGEHWSTDQLESGSQTRRP